ncbi:MAG: phosphatase [Clostridia bacterium]|nr:phosphatase [Clostridia bacterium]
MNVSQNLLDLHTHTVSSGHAYSSLLENIRAAKAKGMKIIGVSDHGPMMPGGAHRFYFHNLKILPEIIEGIRVLKGAEVNILDESGEIDIKGKVHTILDYAIASLHIPCFENLEKIGNTNALINAMKHPVVKIIGHPDDSRYPMDYEKLVLAAIENHVLIEINNSSLWPTATREGAHENYKTLLAYCKKHNAAVIIGSDAHFSEHVGAMEEAVIMLEAMDFPSQLIANFNEPLFWEYIKG